MKKYGILTLCLFLAGCGTASVVSDTTTAPATVTTGDSEAYAAAWSSRLEPASYSLGVQCQVVFTYSDGSTDTYELDGVLEAQDTDTDNPVAHLSENINSNSMAVDVDGWYQDGRCWTTYYTVQYYEDMTFAQLKQALLVPVDAVQIDSSSIESLLSSTQASETTYTMTLTADGRQRIYTSRYDLYGFSSYSGMEVTAGTIAQTFDAQHYLTKETADFSLSVPVDEDTVQVSMHTEAGWLKNDATAVSVPELDTTAYVSYEDIDTEAISDADITDDLPEDTVTATLKKRLVTRLGYTKSSEDIYTTTFNDSESYIFDFANNQFTYVNHTSRYVYNWRGDTGGFGSSCSYDYSTETGSLDCQESVLSTLQDVKLYLQLELYYCGLSLEDLQAEAH